MGTLNKFAERNIFQMILEEDLYQADQILKGLGEADLRKIEIAVLRLETMIDLEKKRREGDFKT